ncbi:MAG: TIGR01459 family HAD-type hydrolase [Pseudomonadota bacterium]|nr:TIGR01459 family HAD-type hydrolase [Pseudomonadota bacterium]
MTFDLDALDPAYSTILCDIWGVVHDGVRLNPGVAERLMRWAGEGRTIILITNAPRTAETVRGQLDALGLPRAAYRGITTGGQAGIDALVKLGKPVGLIGTRGDRIDLEHAGLTVVEEGFADLACTGLDEDRDTVADYAEQLEALAKQGVTLHCLNPDRVVMVGSSAEICAGALADAYEALGGRTCWYGKPWPAVYDHALGLAGDPPRASVLAIGDGLVTDVVGAARNGLACLYVTGGISRGAGLPEGFAAEHGLGDWSPVGVVDTIG